MSIMYRFIDPVPFKRVIQVAKDGEIEVQYHNNEGPLDPHTIILYDGFNYLYTYTGDGSDTGFTSYGANNPDRIIHIIQQECGEIIDEYDERFFNNKEEEEDGTQETDNPSMG